MFHQVDCSIQTIVVGVVHLSCGKKRKDKNLIFPIVGKSFSNVVYSILISCLTSSRPSLTKSLHHTFTRQLPNSPVSTTTTITKKKKKKLEIWNFGDEREMVRGL